jgi:hypothetical protein
MANALQLYCIRPTTDPELTEVPLTAKRLADELETIFENRVEWWGG